MGDRDAYSESVTVNAGATNDNPAVSMTVSREFVENMPLNGRSFQDLIQLAPGTVSNGNGYYSINGQRIDANNYSVDGVSANLGGANNATGNGELAPGLSGASPLQTALGTTQSLSSIDSLQEFTIQTSGYAAEYGRSPGGQVQFTTRSGTNDIHGTLFEYLRNTAFDANTFENDFYGYPQTAEHQNDFGGTVGGPVVIPKIYNGKDNTFYFIAYEGLRLILPNFESEYVPTQALREWASPNVQPFLNSLPVSSSQGSQDGCTIPDPTSGQPTPCDAPFAYAYSSPSNLDNISLRLDQNFAAHFHAFLRYADTPSSTVTGAEDTTTSAINTHTWTAGLTDNISGTLLNDIRFNFSHDGEEHVDGMRSVEGSVPFERSLLIPAAYDTPYSAAAATICTAHCFGPFYQGGGTAQHQYQFVDSFTWTRAHHSLKFGADWRRLTPIYSNVPYYSVAVIQGLTAIQQGFATTLQVSVYAPGEPVFDNVSFYAQDHFKFGSRLSLDYGLRWDFNPPPGPSNGHYPATLTSSNLATATIAPVGTAPYKTDYHSFAPRLGFAWSAIRSPKHAVTVRGGVGIFFDTAQNVIGEAYADAYPFGAQGPTLANVSFPLSSATLAPPSLNFPITPPYPFLKGVSSPDLTAPYTEQWNLSVDEELNPKNTLTMSYVGNAGRKLLFSGYYSGGTVNPVFAGGIYGYTTNSSQSSYNALQIQDRGRLLNGLDMVASFTLAHALDNASSDFSIYAPVYGNSDNDIRRMLNVALNYQTPSFGTSNWKQALAHGWLLANRFSTQSGYPLDIIQSYVPLSNGANAEYRPDLLPNIPIYLHGSSADVKGLPVPANWRLNAAAFALVPTDSNGDPIRQGTLGRNYVRNPSFWALNTAIQRNFPIYERLRLNFRAEAFNIFNHPNLTGPDTYLPDSTFGQLVYGETTSIGSSNALYAMGATRSLQLSLKLQF
jgi:hypothetical protein